MNFFLFINANKCWYFNIYERGKWHSRLIWAKKIEFLDIFYTYEHLKFHAQLNMKKVFITSRPGFAKVFKSWKIQEAIKSKINVYTNSWANTESSLCTLYHP